MADVRNNFSTGLDLDSSPLYVRRTSYTDALNITRDAIAGQADEVITNVIGNRIIPYDYPSGRGKYICLYSNTTRNTIIGFRWNENGYNGIYETDATTRVINKIFESRTDSNDIDILNFTENDKITSVNIFNRDEGDLLFFLDSLGRPTKIDITLFKAGTYTPVTRKIIDVSLVWPYQPITCVYDNDTTKTANNLINKLFKFQYIWINDDFTETCGSPESATSLPNKILDPAFTNTITNNNVIRLSIPSGAKNVSKVKLLMSFSEKQDVWTDFVLVDTIDKSKQSINDDIVFNFNFYNDSTYPLFDLVRRIQLFDYVPLYANAQEMPAGNYLAYGGITEGYDNDLEANVTLTINTVAAGSGGNIGNLNAVTSTRTASLFEILTVTFNGIPGTGTVVTIKVKRLSDNVILTVATYTTLAGDTSVQVADGIRASAISIGIAVGAGAVGSTVEITWLNANYDYDSLLITPPTSAASLNSIATWPFLSQRTIGLAYFDEKGVTNGVIYNSQIIFPNYAENGSQQVLLPYINAKVYHQPPDFAYSYSWVITQDPTQYLYFECTEVNSTESQYLYFNITNLPLNQRKNPTTTAVVGWNFQDGDRLRLIRRMSDGNVFGTTYDINVEGIVVSPSINGVTQTDKTFVKIRKTAPFASENYSSNFFIFKLYRPTQSQASTLNKPFFEFGETYQILNPTESTRVHAGMVQDQSTDYATPAEFNFYNGDAYFRQRTVYIAENGFGTFNVQDRNFVDFYISAVNSLDGRPNAVDPNAKQTYNGTLIRYSQQYEPNTNVNKTNRFTETNFDEYAAAFGDIQRLKARDRFMRVFQKLKVGVVNIFNEVGKSPDGKEITINTDKLLNPIQYYSGDYGIGDTKESLASFNYADYFCSNITGGIYRLSLNGMEALSVLYKVNSWATEHIPLRTGNSKIYGAFDQRVNDYVIALESANYNTNPSCKTYRLTNNNLTPKGYLYRDCSGLNQSGTLAPGEGSSVTFCALVGSVIGVDLLIEVLGSCSDTITDAAYTLSFAEGEHQEPPSFESPLSFHPEAMCNLGTLFVSAKDGEIWTHDSDVYNNFYGVQYDSSITFVFNENPLMKKTWISVNEVASGVWDCPTIETNSYSYGRTTQLSNLVAAEFVTLEGNISASFRRDSNSQGGKINGDFLKGNYVIIKFRKQAPTDLQDLSLVSVSWNESPLNRK